MHAHTHTHTHTHTTHTHTHDTPHALTTPGACSHHRLRAQSLQKKGLATQSQGCREQNALRCPTLSPIVKDASCNHNTLAVSECKSEKDYVVFLGLCSDGQTVGYYKSSVLWSVSCLNEGNAPCSYATSDCQQASRMSLEACAALFRDPPGLATKEGVPCIE